MKWGRNENDPSPHQKKDSVKIICSEKDATFILQNDHTL